MSTLTDMLMRHEGVKLLPYTDTVGKLTIGVGRNLTDNGISHDEAILLLENDVQHIIGELRRAFPWFDLLLAARQDAVADMAFNLGMPRLKGFVKFLAAMEQNDYPTAKKEMLASHWADQVGHRAVELSDMILTGAYQ